MVEKKYITTPIYYMNDKPHIGHAFTTLCADYLARHYRSRGYKVFFLTGTDEHGKKIEESALKNNKKPKEFVDEIVKIFKDAWKKLNISYDAFIRTTDEKHIKKVQEIFQRLYDNGDLYKGVYKGKYCVSCEAYYTDDELIDGKCPYHKKPVIEMEEESYFFKLSKYESKLKKLFEEDFIFPKRYKNEILSRLNKGLKDVSVSRKNLSWGIPLPFDKEHVVYVWFDALLNYISGLKDEFFWPPTHLMAKEILWFHSIYWPAILFALGKEQPKLFVHGWWTVEGEKMSKSLGNVITIEKLLKYGVEPARYFLLRQMSYGEDSNFSNELFKERYEELLNNVSNLVYRVAKIIEKNDLVLEGKLDDKIIEKIRETEEELFSDLEVFKIQSSLQRVMEFAKFLNKYINDYEPWKLVKEDREKATEVLYNLVYGIDYLRLILEPATPSLALEIKDIFSFKEKTLKDFKAQKTYDKPKPKMLLKKIDTFEF